MLCRRGLAWLPWAFLAIQLTGLTITYILAAVHRDVTLLLPYISDAGAKAPERSVFSIMLTINSVLAFGIIAVRAQQVAQYNKGNTNILWWNKVSLYFGMASVLGMHIVAAFQDDELMPAHVLGAMLIFVCGLFYAACATVISYKAGASPCLSRLRLALTLGSLVAMLVAMVAGYISKDKLPNEADVPEDCPYVHWKDHNIPWPGLWHKCLTGGTGYYAHVVSAFGEWFLAAQFTLFFLTFAPDFGRITWDMRVRLHDDSGVYDTINNF